MRKYGVSIFGIDNDYPGNFELGMPEEKVKQLIKEIATEYNRSYDIDNANHLYSFSDGMAFKAYFTCKNGELTEIDIPCWMAKSKFIDYHEFDIDTPLGCIVGFEHLDGTEVLSKGEQKNGEKL